MNVVKLANPGESRLQHLDIGLCCDGLDIISRHPADETIHQLAPGPETVRRCSPDLGETRHSALERVAVQITDAGKPDPVALIVGLRGTPGDNADDAAGVDGNADVTGPALRQQSLVKKQSPHTSSP